MTAPSATELPTAQPNVPANSRHPGPRAVPSVSSVLILPPGPIVDRHRRPQERLQAARRPPAYPNQARIIAPVTPSHPSAVLTPSTCMNRWIRAKLSRQLTDRRIQKQRAGVRTALQTRGWTVDVFWSDGDPAKGEFSNFAVTVTIDSLAEWPAACEEFIPKLQELSVPGESPLLVPVVNDRSVLRFTVRVGSRVWAVGELGEFEHLRPEQLDQRLTGPFVAARSALEVYSTLSVLSREGGLHSNVRQLLERTLLDYNQAMTAIRAVGEDMVVGALTEWLGEIQRQVEKEWSGEIAAGTFATSIVEGVLEPESPEPMGQVFPLLLSLQWDSDAAGAIAWLESLEE